MKKDAKTKKMTIDKLAIMVAKGFDSIETRMATKTDLAAQQKTLKIHGDVLEIMLKEITAIHKDTKSFRDNISTLYTDHVGYDRKLSNLTVRVEKLELRAE